MDNALERARAAYGTGAYDDATLEFLFPQLKESEDERIRRTLVEYFGPKAQLDFVRGVPIRKIRDWLEKQKEQKPAEWSEEDSDNLERVNDYLWTLDDYISDDCAMPQGKTDKIRVNIQKVLSPWLKSLSKRFNLQPKQEWSKEDEKNLELVIDCVYEFYPDPVMKYKLKDWLKSLRPSWKPSEEQMDSLRRTITWLAESGNEKDCENLAQIHKKLKGEEEPEYYQHFDPDC